MLLLENTNWDYFFHADSTCLGKLVFYFLDLNLQHGEQFVQCQNEAVDVI